MEIESEGSSEWHVDLKRFLRNLGGWHTANMALTGSHFNDWMCRDRGKPIGNESGSYLSMSMKVRQPSLVPVRMISLVRSTILQ